jgi:hypothetical protein
MCESARPNVGHVIGPCGRLTAADLPSPQTRRWSIRRKAEVVAGIRGGLLSLDDAWSRYALNIEEFLSWQYCVDQWTDRVPRDPYSILPGTRRRGVRIKATRDAPATR